MLMTLVQAARQGHQSTIEVLIQAGASLGGADERFAAFLAREAAHNGDHEALKTWKQCGVDVKVESTVSPKTVDTSS
jgi:lysophospholipase